MPSEETEEGLVLKSLDYRDRQKIITLFTPNKGLVSLIVKNITRKKTHLLTLTSPFTRAQYHFSTGRTDLYTFRDGSPINTHHDLRSHLSHITAATDMAKALLTSQLPGKGAPSLYQLTIAYLKHLPSLEDPSSLTASFYLKLLLHEGHLSFDHLPFTSEEKPLIQELATTRALVTFEKHSVSEELLEKIRAFVEKKLK